MARFQGSGIQRREAAAGAASLAGFGMRTKALEAAFVVVVKAADRADGSAEALAAADVGIADIVRHGRFSFPATRPSLPGSAPALSSRATNRPAGANDGSYPSSSVRWRSTASLMRAGSFEFPACRSDCSQISSTILMRHKREFWTKALSLSWTSFKLKASPTNAHSSRQHRSRSPATLFMSRNIPPPRRDQEIAAGRWRQKASAITPGSFR